MADATMTDATPAPAPIPAAERQVSATTLWLRKKEAECPGFIKSHYARYAESKKRWREANKQHVQAMDAIRQKEYRKRESVRKRRAARAKIYHAKYYQENRSALREKRKNYYWTHHSEEKRKHREYLQSRKNNPPPSQERERVSRFNPDSDIGPDRI